MTRSVSFREAFRYWLRLGFVNFGGPAGQIALMHEDLVERRRWIDEARFLHALNFCMLLPGPEAQQLAIYIGWLLHGVRGGLAAGVLFVLPAFVLILVLAALHALHGQLAPVAALFYGLRAAVLAIVGTALLRIGARALSRPGSFALAGAAFLAIFAFGVPFPWIVGAAAFTGLALARMLPASWGGDSGSRPGAGQVPESVVALSAAALAPASPRRALRAIALGLAAWWGPLAALLALVGPKHVLAQQALFFSQAAVVTFGGAYAVLSYIHQAAVGRFGWLSTPEMLDGLGLAESTPGPLIMVTEFVGFLGAFRAPGAWTPLLNGALGAAVTTWATFAPCFLWIFAGAPYVERLRTNRALAASLAAVTAAVVGVVLNLGVWLGLHTLFGTVKQTTVAGLSLPVADPASLDPLALAIAVVGFAGMRLRAWSTPRVVLASAGAGLLRFLLA